MPRAAPSLVDDNKRLAWVVTYAFCQDGLVLDPENDAYELVVDVAAGVIDDVDAIAATLTSFAVSSTA